MFQSAYDTNSRDCKCIAEQRIATDCRDFVKIQVTFPDTGV